MTPDPLVFEKPGLWAVKDPLPGCLLWSRFPTSQGPVDIWLPPTATVEELTELVLPRCLDVLRDHQEWKKKLAEFRARKTKPVPATDVLDALAGLAAPTPKESDPVPAGNG